MRVRLGTITKNMRRRSLREVVSITSKIGYDAIEISVRPNERHVSLDQILSDDGRLVTDTVEEGNLSISGLSCHLNLLDPEKGARFQEHFDKAIRAASTLHVPVVIGIPGKPPHPARSEGGFESLEDAWRPRIELAEELGIKIALEAFPPNIAYNIPTIERMFEVLDSDHVGLNFDPSHAVWQGIDNYRIIKKFSDRILHAHAKDTEI